MRTLIAGCILLLAALEYESRPWFARVLRFVNPFVAVVELPESSGLASAFIYTGLHAVVAAVFLVLATRAWARLSAVER